MRTIWGELLTWHFSADIIICRRVGCGVTATVVEWKRVVVEGGWVRANGAGDGESSDGFWIRGGRWYGANLWSEYSLISICFQWLENWTRIKSGQSKYLVYIVSVKKNHKLFILEVWVFDLPIQLSWMILKALILKECNQCKRMTCAKRRYDLDAYRFWFHLDALNFQNEVKAALRLETAVDAWQVARYAVLPFGDLVHVVLLNINISQHNYYHLDEEASKFLILLIFMVVIVLKIRSLWKKNFIHNLKTLNDVISCLMMEKYYFV